MRIAHSILKVRLIRFVFRLTAAVAAMALGAALFVDSILFVLSTGDPEAGIDRGCYTTIEVWLGSHHPSGIVRLSEFALGSVLVLGPIAWLLTVTVRRLRRSRLSFVTLHVNRGDRAPAPSSTRAD